ncbi:hypothetical protein GCM10010424_73550 [Streptomyces lienomycini]
MVSFTPAPGNAALSVPPLLGEEEPEPADEQPGRSNPAPVATAAASTLRRVGVTGMWTYLPACCTPEPRHTHQIRNCNYYAIGLVVELITRLRIAVVRHAWRSARGRGDELGLADQLGLHMTDLFRRPTALSGGQLSMPR